MKQVDYKVDCVIFSGVLLYEKDHYKMFTNIMNYYNCTNAVIQEPYHTQKYYEEKLKLKPLIFTFQFLKPNKIEKMNPHLFSTFEIYGKIPYSATKFL